VFPNLNAPPTLSSRRPSGSRRPIAIDITLVLVYVLGMLNFWTPILRFTWPPANKIAIAAMQLIPLILMVLTARARWGGVVRVILLPAVAFGLPVGSCAVIECARTRSGKDLSFELIQEVRLSEGHLGIYRTNGGATTSFGMEVWQECRLLPGLLRVRILWSAYPAYTVQTRILTPDRLEFSSPAYEHAEERVDEVKLGRFWCPTEH